MVSRCSDPSRSLGTTKAFLTKGGCSETLLFVLNRTFGHSLPAEERASGPLSGGILQYGYQCGQIWGAVLAAGAEAHHRFETGPQAQAMSMGAAQRIVNAFRTTHGATDCYDFMAIDEKSSVWKMVTTFLLKGGTVTCMRMGHRTAAVAYRAICDAFDETPKEMPPGPVSCAALLAERMGASDLQMTMAAGLAGGIGLSGGACGALGTAVWLTGLRGLQQGNPKVPFKAPTALAVIDRFLKASDYEFECDKLVGRTFASVEDHARHVCQGGCGRLLEALAGS